MNDIASYEELGRQFDSWWERYEHSDIENKGLPKVAAMAAFMDAWRRAEDWLTAVPISEYVEHRIHDIFLEVAEMVNDASIPEEESAGVPMKLFQGETLLINVWKQYVETEGLKGE